ncbi:hypothetical protein CV_3404 [Chromobacterium violaceum ATCC 12472]|uniref:Uncharacterized protein n=1 Tax=Chromobacterium violaceum (strain ATCC 12472 / DSM 30191 / JCM 1249 / CCUG 213 / NBRC 12614 / NCIMB 9131 / NCTC 9757 / MK) TaxID=243365 RepID=Q7NSL8_CHRVO|nr:hypothetical protein CV_3404 [Chromobacterium violaceum ATCC 12472]
MADVQPLGGAGEVQLLGHGEEVTQVAQFHIDTLKVLIMVEIYIGLWFYPSLS